MNEDQAFGVRRVGAILIVIFLACPVLFVALTMLPVSAWMFDRGFYLGLVDDARLFELPDAIPGAAWSSGVIEGTGGLQWRSVQRAARVLLTPSYLREQARRVINQAFDSMDGRAPWSDISVDVRPLKSALRADAGPRFARILAEDLPTGGRPEDFRPAPGRLPVSRPSALSVERAAALIQAGIPTFLSEVPDTIHLSQRPWWHDGRAESPSFPVRGGILAGGLVMLLFGLGFLAGAAFLAARTLRQRLQWFGWPLLAPAAGAFLTGLAVIAASSWVPWGIASAHLDIYGFSSSFIAAVVQAARHAAHRVGVSFLAAGGIAAGVSLGLLAWSWTMPRKETSVAA